MSKGKKSNLLGPKPHISGTDLSEELEPTTRSFLPDCISEDSALARALGCFADAFGESAAKIVAEKIGAMSDEQIAFLSGVAGQKLFVRIEGKLPVDRLRLLEDIVVSGYGNKGEAFANSLEKMRSVFEASPHRQLSEVEQSKIAAEMEVSGVEKVFAEQIKR